MSDVLEVPVSPVVFRKFERLEHEKARLAQLVELKNDEIVALKEIITCLREQVASHTREHQLLGALHAADLQRIAKPKE